MYLCTTNDYRTTGVISLYKTYIWLIMLKGVVHNCLLFDCVIFVVLFILTEVQLLEVYTVVTLTS